MINKFYLSNFKCINEYAFNFNSLNLLTGKNSSGKTSVIQALQLFVDNLQNTLALTTERDMRNPNKLGTFAELANYIQNANVFQISACWDEKHGVNMHFKPDGGKVNTKVKIEEKISGDCNLLSDSQFFYLPANRESDEDVYGINPLSDISLLGNKGQYVIDYYSRHAGDLLAPEFCVSADSRTLESQVNYWLKKIAGYELDVKPQNDTYQVFFVKEGKSSRPMHVGTGIGFLAAQLIVCLAASKNSIIVIENPEIHLHPAAQAELTQFFAFVSKMGRQLLIETHSDHIINGTLVALHQQKLSVDNVRMYYFEDNTRLPAEEQIVQLEVYQDGSIKHTPKGFGDQIDIDLKALIGF